MCSVIKVLVAHAAEYPETSINLGLTEQTEMTKKVTTTDKPKHRATLMFVVSGGASHRLLSYTDN
jgi:hypothetical protein